MFFKDYQILALQYLWNVQDNGAISREVWENVNLQMKGTISRVSIINSLNEMVDDNLGITCLCLDSNPTAHM